MRPRLMRCVYFMMPALALTLSGCLFRHHYDHRGDVIYSPNGEPLSGGPLGHPVCAMAIGRWFDRVDSHHDGYITLSEYLIDAKRQFQAMDLDRSGVLTPSELARYRAPYGGEAAATDDRPDPVMSADSLARFEVTLPEFLSYEQQYFLALDSGQTGRVARAVFLLPCADY